MAEPFTKLPIFRYKHGEVERVEDGIVGEFPVSLTVNGRLWLTFMCSPSDLQELAIGFLYNEGIISSKKEIADVYVCKNMKNVDVWLTKSIADPQNWRRTSGCTGGYTAAVVEGIQPVSQNKLTISPESILELVRQLFEAQELYRSSGGVHSSALSDGHQLLTQVEDVGRHNTLDKLAGIILLDDIDVDPKIILTTGRISSEMCQKAARMNASILVSRTAPTSMSVELADNLGITLVGYARGQRFNLYCHPERIKSTSMVV